MVVLVVGLVVGEVEGFEVAGVVGVGGVGGAGAGVGGRGGGAGGGEGTVAVLAGPGGRQWEEYCFGEAVGAVVFVAGFRGGPRLGLDGEWRDVGVAAGGRRGGCASGEAARVLGLLGLECVWVADVDVFPGSIFGCVVGHSVGAGDVVPSHLAQAVVAVLSLHLNGVWAGVSRI